MRGRKHGCWQLDEVFVKNNGLTHDIWRAVDHGGGCAGKRCFTKTRDRKAELKILMKRHGGPEKIVTDRLRSYGGALKDLGRSDDRDVGR